jgi:hypothetical protein
MFHRISRGTTTVRDVWLLVFALFLTLFIGIAIGGFLSL